MPDKKKWKQTEKTVNKPSGLTLGERETRVVLSKELKLQAEQCRETAQDKSWELFKQSKDVLSEGSIQPKLDRICEITGAKLPTFEQTFGNTTVQAAMKQFIIGQIEYVKQMLEEKDLEPEFRKKCEESLKKAEQALAAMAER